jgi:4-hydroxy-tetrahydrodipicolinate synthase
MAVLSGDDVLNLPFYAVGARGCISVASNVVPGLVAGAWDASAVGDFKLARELHYRMLPLVDALFSETSPTPVKAALAMMGSISPEIRAPLYPMAGAARERLRAVLAEHGLV